MLARMYYLGQGVTQSHETAAKWYQKAADQGIAVAQYMLGRMYYTGEGVDKDVSKAIEWFTKAANQGNHDAKKILKIYKKIDN